MRAKLTDRLARSLPTIPGKILRIADSDKHSPPGFLLRITPADARAWALRYRVKSTGIQREATIGDIKSWPIIAARKEAHKLRRLIDTGGDPLAEREQKRGAPTVAELWARFEVEALPSRAPRTQDEYRAQARDWILPLIGRLKVAAVSRADIEKLHRRITESGWLRRANSVKSLASTVFRQAVAWGLRPDNPCTGIKGNREHVRRRYLDDEKGELERLEAALDEWRPKRSDSVDIIEIAMLTGARRGEILGMRWSDIDLTRAVWHQQPAQTKQRDWHSPALPARAVEILQRRKGEREARTLVRLHGDDFVFAGGASKTASNRFEKDWRRIRATAGLDNFRFHDIRHSVASWLISANLNLDVVGQVLGHKKAATSRRYAHLHDAVRRTAAEIIGAKVRR
jgi:integrase